MSYPELLEIEPLKRPPSIAVQVPGSKSITNRALVLAALSSQGTTCQLRGCLRSEDTEVMIAALRQLGFRFDTQWDHPDQIVEVSSEAGHIIPAASGELFTGNSGTTLRFLTAMVSLGSGRYRLDGVARMRERPVQDLLEALQQLGVDARSERGNGCPPVVIETSGLRGGTVKIKGDISSQFLSGLLMAASRATGDLMVEVDGPLVSWPYVAMTVDLLRQWSVNVEVENRQKFFVPAGRLVQVGSFSVEPDASAASYFFGAAAIAGGRVTVLEVPERSIQGDIRFAALLEEMGCKVGRCSSGVTVHGRALHGIDVDMNDISDTVMTLAAVACFAEGPTTIRNVAHIRHKETDRLAALATELRRVGTEVEEFADGLSITPRPLRGGAIETYNDHRMAMSMALIGLRVPGIVIKNPGCVAKTYPGFWDDIEQLRG